MLLPKLQQLEVEHEELLRLALVQSYLQTLRRACEVVSTQCPPTALDVYHLATIESIAGGLLDRVKLRMWFLRADHLLQNWNSVQSESITPDVEEVRSCEYGKLPTQLVSWTRARRVGV